MKHSSIYIHRFIIIFIHPSPQLLTLQIVHSSLKIIFSFFATFSLSLSLLGIQTHKWLCTRWLAFGRWSSIRWADVWFRQRVVQERRSTYHVGGSGWCTWFAVILRWSHHYEHLSKVENRIGDRGSAVENWHIRNKGLLGQWHCRIAK